MSTSDSINLSPKTIASLADLLSKHRGSLKDDMEKLVGKIGGSTAGGFSGTGGRGPGNISGTLKEQAAELKLMIRHLSRANAGLSAYEKYMLASANAQQKAVLASIKQIEEETERRKAAGEAADEETTAREDHTDATKRSRETVKDFAKSLISGSIAVKGFNDLVNETRQSYKLGMKWDPVSDALAGIKMGMDPKEMMDFQAQFRRTSGSMAGGMAEFNKTVADNQTQMIQYTGSMKGAAMAMGNMYEISNSMGLNLSDVGNSANDLFSQFKKMNAATSLTIDQFTDLTKSLVDDGDIRSKLLSLQGQQRGAYIQSLLKQQDLLQSQGMTLEAAQKFVKYVESNSNKSPMERMKAGAQLMMFAKQMGMSTRDANEFMLLNNKREKTEAETNRFKQLGADLNSRAHQNMDSGPMLSNGIKQGEFLVKGAMEKLNINLDQFDDAALQTSAKRDPAAVAIQTAKMNERQTDVLQNIYKQAVIISDVLGAWSNAALGVAVGGIALSIMNRKGGMVDRLLDRGIGGNPGTPPPAGGGWRGKVGTSLGRGGAALGLATTGVMAGAAVDSSTATGAGLSGALTGAGIGAGVGMMFGPVIGAFGGALGALTGAAVGLYNYSNDYSKQAQDMIKSGNVIQSGAEVRARLELDSAKQQLDTLQRKGKLTADEVLTVDKLTASVSKLSNTVTVEEQKSSMSMLSSFGPAGQALINDKVGSTNDLSSKAASIDALANMAGIKGANSKDLWFKNAARSAMDDGRGDDVLGKIATLQGASRDGKDVSIPPEIQKYIDAGAQATIKQYTDAGQSQLAGMSNNLKSADITSLVNSSIAQANDVDKKIAVLQSQRDDAAKAPVMDEFGMGNWAEVTKIDKQIEELKASRVAQSKMAQGFEDSLNGDRSLSVVLDADTLKNFEAIFKGKKPMGSGNATNDGN